jgi:hypothetical protein
LRIVSNQTWRETSLFGYPFAEHPSGSKMLSGNSSHILRGDHALVARHPPDHPVSFVSTLPYLTVQPNSSQNAKNSNIAIQPAEKTPAWVVLIGF